MNQTEREVLQGALSDALAAEDDFNARLGARESVSVLARQTSAYRALVLLGLTGFEATGTDDAAEGVFTLRVPLLALVAERYTLEIVSSDEGQDLLAIVSQESYPATREDRMEFVRPLNRRGLGIALQKLGLEL